MKIRMTTNLFRAARMNNVYLPDINETVELDEDSAKRLIDAGHAEAVVDGEPDPEPEPVTPLGTADLAAPVVETAAVETPENAAAEKPRRGRPPKSE